MSEPRLLTRKAVAEYFSVAPSSVDRMVKRGTLPRPVKLDGIVRWDRQELDKIIDGKKRKARYVDPDEALDRAFSGGK